MRMLSNSAACYLLVGFMAIPAQAALEIAASRSLTVQSGGPRSGDAGSKYSVRVTHQNERGPVIRMGVGPLAIRAGSGWPAPAGLGRDGRRQRPYHPSV